MSPTKFFPDLFFPDKVLGIKANIAPDNESLSYRIGVSIGIAMKEPVKRVCYNKRPTVGCIQFDLSSIGVTESKLYLLRSF